MQQIICTFEQYDIMEQLFDEMYFKADEYVPTEEQLYQEILPNLTKYIKFLLWIDITGKSTDENCKMRKRIRQIIRENLLLVEDLSEIENLKEDD